MRLIKSMRLTASVRLIERTWALRAGPSSACVTNVKDRHAIESVIQWHHDNLAAQTWASLVNQTTPTAAFIHPGINTRRVGLANCLYHFESTRTMNVYYCDYDVNTACAMVAHKGRLTNKKLNTALTDLLRPQ